MNLRALFARPQPEERKDDERFPAFAYPRVDIFFWSPRNKLNFGDYLASAVVARMLARREMLADEPVGLPTSLFSIGSVLHFARDGETVWGSGRNGKIADEAHGFSCLDVRAVRGPLTREWLVSRGIACPAIFGDPALLIPQLFPTRFRRAATPGKIGIVPNLNDLALVHDPRVIDPTARWDTVIDAILSCEFVVASSLHGLIIADAFGVPCTQVRLGPLEHDFKYEDYHRGAGRTLFWSSGSIEESIARGPLPPTAFDPAPLMAAFPYDLWEAGSA
ncbi:MAG: polysaccharide pyruvyl transferase family protein [Porphyrobacter sp.]|nr:polysaccharide pyruvyl transferase family protein [Porphyrobacter sp.]